MSLFGTNALAGQVAAGLTAAALIASVIVNVHMTPHIFASARYAVSSLVHSHCADEISRWPKHAYVTAENTWLLKGASERHIVHARMRDIASSINEKVVQADSFGTQNPPQPKENPAHLEVNTPNVLSFRHRCIHAVDTQTVRVGRGPPHFPVQTRAE